MSYDHRRIARAKGTDGRPIDAAPFFPAAMREVI
jgi:hypothetical protein